MFLLTRKCASYCFQNLVTRWGEESSHTAKHQDQLLKSTPWEKASKVTFSSEKPLERTFSKTLFSPIMALGDPALQDNLLLKGFFHYYIYYFRKNMVLRIWHVQSHWSDVLSTEKFFKPFFSLWWMLF